MGVLRADGKDPGKESDQRELVFSHTKFAAVCMPASKHCFSKGKKDNRSEWQGVLFLAPASGQPAMKRAIMGHVQASIYNSTN